MDIMVWSDVIFWFILFIVLFMAGWAFFVSGITALSDYDPEYDEKKKKHDAIADVYIGIVLLIFHNLFFWLVISPLVIKHYNLNLPAFSL